MPDNAPSLKGDWVTNVPDTIRGLWPRRDAKMVEGPPQATEKYSVMELEEMNIVGVFLDEDIPEGIKSRELLLKPVVDTGTKEH